MCGFETTTSEPIAYLQPEEPHLLIIKYAMTMQPDEIIATQATKSPTDNRAALCETDEMDVSLAVPTAISTEENTSTLKSGCNDSCDPKRKLKT